MAENRKYFEDQVIAEMRGMVNDSGHSPFWDAVGKNFFKIDFPTADYLYMKNKRFIEEMMPKYPIIANLLPEDAQFVIGKVHPNTEPAKKILEQEGFRFSGLVGILEPGPVLKADVDNIRAIRESVIGEIKEISDKNFKSEIFIISRTTGNFRSALGGIVKLKSGGYKILGVTAAALKLRLGDKIRFVSFKPKATVKKKVAVKRK
jgi:arginine N-succinyltransferase